MLSVDIEDSKERDSASPREDSKVDNKLSPTAPVSATKRKLIEAKEKDAQFDREQRAEETSEVVREVSKMFVAEALLSATTHLVSPGKVADRRK